MGRDQGRVWGLLEGVERLSGDGRSRGDRGDGSALVGGKTTVGLDGFVGGSPFDVRYVIYTGLPGRFGVASDVFNLLIYVVGKVTADFVIAFGREDIYED